MKLYDTYKITAKTTTTIASNVYRLFVFGYLYKDSVVFWKRNAKWKTGL